MTSSSAYSSDYSALPSRLESLPVGTIVPPQSVQTRNDGDKLLAQPIGIILSSSGNEQVLPGETIELSVTVNNKGNKSAIIDIFLDNLPEVLHGWCATTQTRLALDPGQGEEVVFTFDVPLTAMSGGYRYWLTVDAPNHYPDHPRQRFEQNLQVLPPTKTAVKVNDPTFAIAPTTTSAQPAKTMPGSPLQFQVHVYNRADRVDRFRLHCNDLPASWLTITYPQGFQMPGLTEAADCLKLNPGESGVILLTVQPPADAISQVYASTLQLKAENTPTLKLFDILYLDIQPIYRLETRFKTLVSQIHAQPGLFSIQASNHGNTPRTLAFDIVGLQDGNLCDYAIDPQVLTLAPLQTLTSQIAVRPKNGWKRPWIGAGKIINFEVSATDQEKKPLPVIPMTGVLTWKARPFWQLLPLLLLLAGSAAGIVWLIWWHFIRPPVPPSVLRFAAEDTVYEVSRGDTIHVGFEIANPKRLQQIEIVGQSAEGELLSGPMAFNVEDGIPKQLENNCATEKNLLTCRNIRTDARRTGDYTFTLTLIPEPGRNAQPIQSSALPVSIVPVRPPSIVSIEPSALVYTESETDSADAMARVNWVVDNPGQLQALELVGRDPQGNAVSDAIAFNFSNGQLPNTLTEFCSVEQQLVCNNVPTGLQQAGAYTFELTAIPLEKITDTPISATSEQVTIQSKSPRLISFTINGEPAQPSYLIPVEAGQPPINLNLGWEVEDTPGTQIMLTPAPGTVPAKGTLPIWLSPESKETMFSLQITGATGESITRSINITTYDPTPDVPTIVVNTGEAAEAGGASGANNGANAAGSTAAGGGSRGTETGIGQPIQGRPGTVPPRELSPQFE
ncbi:MAG: hypothetical protein AAF635_04600 [Cyanobacteria bacterium P01_C01_bin.69]